MFAIFFFVGLLYMYFETRRQLHVSNPSLTRLPGLVERGRRKKMKKGMNESKQIMCTDPWVTMPASLSDYAILEWLCKPPRVTMPACLSDSHYAILEWLWKILFDAKFLFFMMTSHFLVQFLSDNTNWLLEQSSVAAWAGVFRSS